MNETKKEMQGLERFIYFIVNDVPKAFRYKSSMNKLKHYLYMANKIANNIKPSFQTETLHEQVITAMDAAHSRILRNHYELDLWDFDFESEVELETTSAYFSSEIEVPSLNYFGYEEYPTVRNVQDNMLNSFREDYIDLNLTDKDEDGVLNRPNPVILLPEEDALVRYLNEDLDALKCSNNYDLTEDQEMEYVSSDGLRKWIDIFYQDMVKELNPDEHHIDAEDRYIEFIEQLDIITMLGDLKLENWSKKEKNDAN